ncbi:hypothetical protein [Jiangella mangrovi]|uniref:LPXTG cell wall anchor domain-containing protein n=1 Tax=Jiangella mangrovi TaxID=1524084 RepID=A0A7W9GKZ4_9ACTN|nr:hypothetical protein [Jiangella mangrovi]MBB5785795.1 hypothetical protein [Jiangella mangrovi]
MRPIRLTATVLTAAALVATASAAGAADTSPDGASAGPPGDTAAPAAAERTVTLLTGDRVVVRSGLDGVERVTVEPADGRDGVAYTQRRTDDGGLRVIPADALDDVAEGRLDARLFDVTALLEQGYDDASEAELPPLDEPAEPEAATDAEAADTFDLTLEAIDRDGQPTHVVVDLGDLGAGTVHDILVSDEEPETVHLPAGMYDLTTTIFTPDPADPRLGSLALIALPELVLDGDLTLTLDAHDAEPVQATVDSPTADPNQRAAGVDAYRHGAGVGTTFDDFELYVTPTPEVTAYPYLFTYTSSLAEPLPADGSPARGYFLYLPYEGYIPEPVFEVHDEDLAQVGSTLHHTSERPDPRTNLYADGFGTAVNTGTSLGLVVPSPGERVDLYSTEGISWRTRVEGLEFRESDTYGDRYHTYEAGQQYERDWNAAPLGPVARPDYEAHLDAIRAGIQPFAPSALGHDLDGLAVSGMESTTSLSKDGVIVGTNSDHGGGTFAVEPDDADWELTTSVTRDGTLATQVDARWSTSGAANENGLLPFVSLRISGDVDLQNRAPAGEPFPVRLALEHADGTLPEPAASTLEVSYDDGGTWQQVPVDLTGGEATATVPAPPAGAQFASLRASAETAEGAAVEQTVIRAYLIGEPATPTASPTPSAPGEPIDDPTLPNTGAGSGGGSGILVALGVALVAGAALAFRLRRGVVA